MKTIRELQAQMMSDVRGEGRGSKMTIKNGTLGEEVGSKITKKYRTSFMNFYQGNKFIGKISKYRSSKKFTFALFEVLHRLFWQTCVESHKNVEEVHKKS